MSDVSDVITSLTERRDRLQEEASRLQLEAGALDEAIAALRKVGERVVMVAPPIPRAYLDAGTVVSNAAAPVALRVLPPVDPPTVCQYRPCGKPLKQSGTGRPRRFCDRVCGDLARKGPEADVDEVLRAPEAIPESASGMKVRIAQALAAQGPAPRSKFLAHVRGKNDEAARRSAAARA